MRTPFTAEQFFDVFRWYNEDIWPGQLILAAIAIVAAVIAMRATARRSRVVMAILVLLWVWGALAYHLRYFVAINPLAYAFSGLFLVQASLLARHGLETGQLLLDPRPSRWTRVAGLVLIMYAVAFYPLVGYALGQRFPELPSLGLPCPTTIFTLGILLWCERPVPWVVLAIPAVWAVIATLAAINFGVGEDLALVPAVLLVIAATARHRADDLPTSAGHGAQRVVAA